MKSTFIRTLTLAALFVGFIGFASSAFASVTPTLSLTATGSGDNVQVTVTGDPNVSVLLSYTEAGVGPTITSLGTTDGNGNFSDVISSAGYNITSGTAVQVITNGTSGPRSATLSWPTVTSSNSLTLSQNAVVLNVGSTASVSATNVSSSLYVSNNSNPSIANVSINGSALTISGNVAGSTSVTLCSVGNTSNCPSLYITVLAAGASQLSLSQNNVSVVSGQNLPITISGGNGSYQILNNSNAGIIQASLSGSVLTLSTGSSIGTSSITVCSTDMSACGAVTATAGSLSSVAVSFSTNAPVVSTGQSTTVNIYGPSGVQFYVSANSNPSVVQANLSGSTLTLSGIQSGTSSVTVCASTGTCASLSATVQYSAIGGNITLSQNSLSVASGQSATITVSGGEAPYSISGGTTSIAQVSLNGSSLTVYGVATGSSSVNVCSAGGGCVVLLISVNGSTTTSGTFSMSQNSLSLGVGQSSVITLYGGSSYYLSGNTGPNVASVAINGSSAVVTALAQGGANATICSGGSCGTLLITVGSTPVTTTPVTTVPVTTTPAFTFTEYLSPGSEDAQVTALQNELTTLGYFTATPTGYYGTVTENAVIAFQAAHGLDQLGVVGPGTRAALNALEVSGTGTGTGSGSVSTTPIASMTLVQLQAFVQTLESELTQALTRISQLSGQ